MIIYIYIYDDLEGKVNILEGNSIILAKMFILICILL